MDKNTWIGFGLIAAIIIGFSIWNRPSQEELARRQYVNDSIAYARSLEMESQRVADSLSRATLSAAEAGTAALTPEAENEHLAQAYGAFLPAARGENQEVVLENEVLRLYLGGKGGRVQRALLKDYKAYGDTLNPLCLFRADEAHMAFTLITNNNRILSTENLYFTPIRPNDSTVIMRLETNVEDAHLDFVYTLPANSYMVNFNIVPVNMQMVLAQNMSNLEMMWTQRIPQQERGRKFEERYAQLQYMTGGDIEKLSESKHDSEKESARVRWIAYKDQFFATVLLCRDGFSGAQFESTPMQKHSGYIKEYSTRTALNFSNQPIALQWYFGPNHYNTLKAIDKADEAEDMNLRSLVPLGWKIVAWINVLLVIPMFDLFMGWGLHIGLVIFLMTVVIKLIILPFVFKSYQSSAKMRVLKPQMDEINAKYPPEKMQERQQATMALYNRAGVSPMSGCLPMLFQFPVLMAMFWFLPTAIELRGQSFLWADDLSTYDAILTWSADLPLIGNHLSLFCILMTVVNIVYTYINMQQQAGGNDPNMKMMKYMMYAMPLMFFFIFNDYAAGLSYYYLVSLFITILQTMIFRWTTDDEKLLKQMENNAKKKAGKPKSGFMQRLEELQREQQRMAREQAKAQSRR